MNNIRNAWLALIGVLPAKEVVEKIVEKEVSVEVVKEAIGKASAVMLYGFSRKTGHKVRQYRPHMLRLHSQTEEYPDFYEIDEYEWVFFHSCDQAHYESNGAMVQCVPCIAVGSSYFKIAEAQPIKVLPKPKVSKGKARAT